MDAVKRSLDAAGIDYCDLAPDMRAEAKKNRQLYLRIGAHWNDEGNRVAADSIAACLADKGLTGEQPGRAPSDTATPAA